MKQLLLDIKTRLLAYIPTLQLVAIYNGQPEKIKAEKDNFSEENKGYYAFNAPACFIEAVNANEIAQLGNGYQIYDPLTIRIHIYTTELDNGMEGMDENLTVFDLKQQVFMALQKHQFDGAATMARIAENLDYNHNNVYIYLMDFITNYVDITAADPVGGQEIPASVDFETGITQLIVDTDFE